MSKKPRMIIVCLGHCVDGGAITDIAEFSFELANKFVIPEECSNEDIQWQFDLVVWGSGERS